jgi:hypothetical protein
MIHYRGFEDTRLKLLTHFAQWGLSNSHFLRCLYCAQRLYVVATTKRRDVVEVERMELEAMVKANWLPLRIKLDRSERDFGLKKFYSYQTREYLHLANLLGMPFLMRVLIYVKLDD